MFFFGAESSFNLFTSWRINAFFAARQHIFNSFCDQILKYNQALSSERVADLMPTITLSLPAGKQVGI